MRLTSLGVAAATVTLLSACSSADANFDDAALDSEDQKASYAVGLNLGGQVAAAEGMLDMPAFYRGIQDIMAGNDPAVDEAELQEALRGFSTRVQERQTARMEEEAPVRGHRAGRGPHALRRGPGSHPLHRHPGGWHPVRHLP
jgi:hypothetical protein